MFIKEHQKDLLKIKQLINEAEFIVVGAGSGLTASAGFNYQDEEFFKRDYLPFHQKGFKTVWDLLVNHWSVNDANCEMFWASWAFHINRIFYQQDQFETYINLYNLVAKKDYFILTTNADGQFFKGHFNRGNIFAMQGSYAYFQCQRPCREVVYHNKEYIEAMLASFEQESLSIAESTVPHCPNCGELLKPNLRVDDTFVEKLHQGQYEKYIDFLERGKNKNLLLLELGVGFNTPMIIKYPFERMVRDLPNAKLIRINIDNTAEHTGRHQGEYNITYDISEIIKKLL